MPPHSAESNIHFGFRPAWYAMSFQEVFKGKHFHRDTTCPACLDLVPKQAMPRIEDFALVKCDLVGFLWKIVARTATTARHLQKRTFADS